MREEAMTPKRKNVWFDITTCKAFHQQHIIMVSDITRWISATTEDYTEINQIKKMLLIKFDKNNES